MPSLFYLPKVASLPGSKLYFFQTETSTPQNVYTDADLSVAHSQPVVADGAGVFAPIYFDGTLGDYRISHYTSADVLIYTVDDVPSGPGNLVTSLLVAQTNNPKIRFRQKGASANNADWIVQVASEQLKLSLTNTALSSAADFLVIDRANNVATLADWTVSSHKINGDESHRGASEIKEASDTLNTSTTLTADADLVLALRGSASYLIEGELYFYASTTAGMGLKFDLSYSGSLSTQRPGMVSSYVNATAGAANMADFPTTPVSFATLSTNVLSPDVCRFSHTVNTDTAGNLSLRWAQVSSSANNLNLLSNSWIRATRI